MGISENDVSSASKTLTGPSFLYHVTSHPGLMSAAAVFTLVGASLSLIQPLMVASVIELITGGQSPEAPLLGLVGVLLGAAACGAAQHYLLQRLAEEVIRNSREKLATHVVRLPIAYFDGLRRGDLLSRITSDTTMLRGAITDGPLVALGSLLVFLGALIAMALINGLLFCITLAVVIVALGSVALASTLIQRLTTSEREAVGRLGTSLDQALSALRTIRAAGAADRQILLIGTDIKVAFKKGVSIAAVEALLGSVSGLASQAAFVIVLTWGGFLAATGQISSADLVSFLLYLFMLAMPLGQIMASITATRSAQGAWRRISEILTMPTENDQLGNAIDAVGPAGHNKNILEFRNVHFSYGDNTILRDVSFDVRRGAVTAVVGRSGAGKSTVFSLIERFYDPDSGTIVFDGMDISSVQRRSLREQIGFVEQRAPILASTVRHNLKLSAPSATESECWTALKSVGLLDRFKDHPDGLDAILGESGVGLSGGEQQRLAIARTLLTDTPLMLFDEPTASLDSSTELAIRDVLSSTSADKSIMVIAHRLSTVAHADSIIVIDEGRVAAVGTHSQLLDDCGLYRDLAANQLISQ